MSKSILGYHNYSNLWLRAKIYPIKEKFKMKMQTTHCIHLAFVVIKEDQMELFGWKLWDNWFTDPKGNAYVT